MRRRSKVLRARGGQLGSQLILHLGKPLTGQWSCDCHSIKVITCCLSNQSSSILFPGVRGKHSRGGLGYVFLIVIQCIIARCALPENPGLRPGTRKFSIGQIDSHKQSKADTKMAMLMVIQKPVQTGGATRSHVFEFTDKADLTTSFARRDRVRDTLVQCMASFAAGQQGKQPIESNLPAAASSSSAPVPASQPAATMQAARKTSGKRKIASDTQLHPTRPAAVILSGIGALARQPAAPKRAAPKTAGQSNVAPSRSQPPTKKWRRAAQSSSDEDAET